MQSWKAGKQEEGKKRSRKEKRKNEGYSDHILCTSLLWEESSTLNSMRWLNTHRQMPDSRKYSPPKGGGHHEPGRTTQGSRLGVE